MTFSNVAPLHSTNTAAVPERPAAGDLAGWAGLPPTRSNRARSARALFQALTITARSAKPTTLQIAAAVLMLPLMVCAAPVQQAAPAATAPIPVPAPASQDTQPLPRGATTAGRPATPARPAPSGPVSTPVQTSGPADPANVPATENPATAPALEAAPIQRPPQVVMPAAAAPSTGGLLQTIFALVLVLGILLGLAWFLKRFGPRGMMGGANVKLVGALNIGGRERIMVVEVGDQWIVVGASPGRVNALATMPRQEGAEVQAQLAGHAPPAASFGDWLKKTIDKRNAN